MEKLDYNKVKAMRLFRKHFKTDIRKLARMYGVSPKTVRDVLQRKTWK